MDKEQDTAVTTEERLRKCIHDFFRVGARVAGVLREYLNENKHQYQFIHVILIIKNSGRVCKF